ncbi:amino acid adenylation domain-containing protein [Kroppenstedtia eburnea]
MPLNRNGKIDRKALPEPDGFGQIATGYTAPRNHWESVLVAIWEEVLGVDRIGIDDNFFNLGGHSLKTIQIRSRIRQQLGVDMELKDLFDHQTVRELAPLLDAAQAGATEKTERIVPAEQADFYPMSHAQQRLFLLHRLEPSNRSYNMPVAVELMGSLDLEVFQQAIQSLQNRHEGLRTTFTVHAGKPVQRVAESLPLDCPLIDLSDRDETAQQQYLEEIGREEAETDFDLTEGPLFRIRLCKLAKDRYVLWMNMHHIISDYWSWQVLIRDFTALYDAFHQGKTPSLPPLTVQYKDYARWQNDRLGRGELAESEAYWLEQFSGDLPILDLPTDHPRPPIQTFTASQATVALGPDRLKRLRGLAQEQEATLFMTLLSAVGAFLSRMSGQQDLVIGTPEAGRNRAELEDLIGFFVNTLPRLNLRAEQTFTELLQHCKRIALDAYTHHEYPFDRLVEKVKPERDLSRSPIFSVMFQLDQPTIETTLNDLNLRPLPSETHMTNFDLTIVGVETESGLDIQFQYRSDLYEEETVNRWLEQFTVMMDGILMDPTQNISEYPLLTDRQHQLLAEWNDTEVDFPQELVHDRFATIARQMPDQTAVEADGVTLTYRELNDRSERLANFLRRKGIGPDDLVGICMERSVEMMVGLFGILKAGGAYVPLDPAFPEERLKYMLEDSGSQAVLTDQPFISSLVQPDVQIIDMKTVAAEIAAESSERPTIQISGDQIAYVIYTSGSTGKPKGVQVSHRSLANLLTSMEKEPGICADDRFLSVTTLSFDICALELFLPLMVGATVVLVRREVVMDGKRLAKAIKTSGATIMQGTPTMWRLLLTAGWAGSPRLKVLCGGEPLTHELAQKLQMCSAELWNLYGPTETTIWSTVHHVTEQKGPIPIGRPTMNTKLYVLDDWMQPVPIGVPGELYIGGVALARGYHNRPELTAERFVPNPFSDEPGSRLYKTGDRARYLSDGNLECLGRVDDQVKLRGYRIEPGEIQGVLIQHPAVAEATVILREDTPGDQRLVAYVTVSEGHELILRDVQRQLADLLPSYMVPSAIVVLDSLPLTLNGKVDHKQLPFPDTPVLQDTYAPPRDLNELDMVRIWEDLLQIKPIGIHDHFFAIGGQSLKALLLSESIRERFGVQLPMTTLFQKPTVAELCVYLDGRTAMNDACLIKLQQGNGTHPPLFFVHPQGGGVLPYVHVIKELGPEETAYGLQAVGYESNDQPLTSIEAMADRYVEEIRRLVPQGPYRLVGWSFGGTVAYEMARQLEDLGEKVDFIGLFDVKPLDRRGERQEEFTERDAMIYFAILFDLDPDPLARMDVEEGLNQLLQRAKERGIWPPSMTLDSMRRKIDVLVACGQAMTDYRYHGPIRSDLHLFRVNQVSKHGHELIDPAEWKPRTAGQVHVFDVPGDHITMADPPNVNVLAKAMKSAWTQVTISPATGGGS